MNTLKDKYNAEKFLTIDQFYTKLERALAFVNTAHSNNYLKDAITDLSMDDKYVSFRLLHHKILLNYTINLSSATTVTAYKQEPDFNIYGNSKFVHVPELDFQFSTALNTNGFKEYQFNSASYCTGNATEKFLVEYLKVLQTTFFP